ncbi:MAG: hypothetical protein J5543_09300 [Bacteroidales bacterium]|nr:hypothetical protein [Bacteroidales bacterium]
MEYSYFDRFSSKIKRINIPVPSYNEGVHTDSRSFYRGFKDMWNYFVSAIQSRPKEYLIGRDIIVERLKTWLLKDRDKGASYLVTGYRGMGKTCFVNRVIEQLVAVVDNIQNVFAYFLFYFFAFWPLLFFLYSSEKNGTIGDLFLKGEFVFNTETFLFFFIPLCLALIWWMVARWPILREKTKKFYFLSHTLLNAVFKEHKWISLNKISPREWNRINNLIFGGNNSEASYSRLCVKINLGQEILREKDILSVLTYQLYEKWRRYCQCSVITDLEKCVFTAFFSFIFEFFYLRFINNPLCLALKDGFISLFTIIKRYLGITNDTWLDVMSFLPIIVCVLIFAFIFLIFRWRRRSVLWKLKQLKKSVDASREHKKGFTINLKPSGKFSDGSISSEDINTYKYDVADTRVIESQLIEILNYIAASYLAPTLYFVFDELDKIEDIDHDSDGEIPEYSNERNFPGGGASRRRKHTVMRLLANMKYFTTTAKAKFIFIAGREMYDGYLADFTDREAAASSLFDGVIYVESFCKNEKSDRNVTYNAETYIARQLIPRSYIKERIIKELIECKLKGSIYDNIDIDLKMYYEFLIMQYARCAAKVDSDEQKRFFDDARKCIDRVIILLYHFSVYLFQISNGSPKKMRINFSSYVRLIKKPIEFQLPKNGLNKSPLEGTDLDININRECKFLLTFTEKEQRVIGFIHYISFPINQIMSNADRFSDKLLVSASFLINHIYKFHKGGFSWRNLEQIPELLEVYKIPEFRSFINSILNYLLQTHMIMIHGGLYDYKFRKQISEEISIASKTSEEVSAIYNFTLDDSQSVKRHYLSLLEHINHHHQDSGTRNNTSMAAYHHILGDLYMSDEEYNNALSQYKIALKLLYEDDNFSKLNEHDPKLQDPQLKNPKLILSIIRNHLKIGLAYEKRRSNLSAYAVYEEIIALLFHYRNFDEKSFGLRFEVNQKSGWPTHETELFPETALVNGNSLQIEPLISNKEEHDQHKQFRNNSYKTRGSRIISDFSNLVTPEKHEVQQRLSLIGDTKFVFQAMLAKLFVIEKIELGGITRENLDVIEGEFQFLHLATNVHEKFIIASDFYRRLGDIMYYKNGLIGFNYNHESNDEKNLELKECLVDSLYYYGFNLKTELHDYCSKNKCFQLFAELINDNRKLSRDHIMFLLHDDDDLIPKVVLPEISKTEFSKEVYSFWHDDVIRKKIKKIPLNDVENCNKKRQQYWCKNRALPCYACRFYHHSLEILMSNWIGVNFKIGERKAISVLRQIVLRGSTRSSRQNFNLQFAEVLDTLGNTMLSCSSDKEVISIDFFTRFIHDAQLLIFILDNDYSLGKFENDPTSEFLLLRSDKLGEPKNNLETAILYYLEASFLFRVGSEHKKAVGSLHKIIKIILNYLRVTSRYSKKDNDDDKEQLRYTDCRALFGELIYGIKDTLIRQCLILLYNHYNFINIMEIQRLKWIFYTDMYEGISLAQLSLFPDIEEIMLNYYEIIRLCIVLDPDYFCYLNERMFYVRKTMKKIQTDSFSFDIPIWKTIEDRNQDFNSKLTILYNNISMGELRNESTVYGRMLSLRFKSQINEYILSLAFPDFNFKIDKIESYYPFMNYFGKPNLTSSGGASLDWKEFFIGIDNIDPDLDPRIDFGRLFLLEYLIKDSIFCLTEILETVTPYTTTTLFTDAFMAGIYCSLYKWSNLFEELFLFYKVFDTLSLKNNKVSIKMEDRSIYNFFDNYDMLFKKESNSNDFNSFKDFVMSKISIDDLTNLADSYNKIWNCSSISDRFYYSVVKSISKPNVYYTLKNYAGEMALGFFRKAKETNREGKAYKDMVNRMYFLDDDLKNDTIQFDLAIERFRINSGDIDRQLNKIKSSISRSIYDIDRLSKNTETELPLGDRFTELHMNIDNNINF